MSLLGDIGGAVLGGIGSSLGGSLFGDASDDAADAIIPGPFVSVGNMGFAAKRNPWQNTFGLSPEMQALYDMYLGQAGMYNDLLSGYLAPNKDDFWGYGANAPTKTLDDFRAELAAEGDYDEFGYGSTNHVLERDALNAYEEYLGDYEKIFDSDAYEKALAEWVSPEKQYADELYKLAEAGEIAGDRALENRLFQQGMLGSTGGANRLGAREDAKQQAAINRGIMAKNYVGNQMASLQANGINSLNAALSIGQIPLQYFNAGLGSQGQNIQAGIAAAPYLAAPGYANADAVAGMFGGLGDAFSNWGSSSGSTGNNLLFNYDDYSFSGSNNYDWGIK